MTKPDLLSRTAADLKRLARDPLLLAVSILTLCSLVLFVVYPIASVALQSLKPGENYSFQAYAETFKSAYLRKAFFNSLMM
ncbi:MAG TPA: hypothetical protein VIO60_08360, partial [Rectinemataceae bacterium]